MSAVNDLTNVIRSITNGLTLKRKNLKALGNEAIRNVVIRTRLGYGVDRNRAKRKRLKPLSPSYVEFRKGKIAFFSLGSGRNRTVVPFKPDEKPGLSEFTRPKRSNLTFTGKMLDSMRINKIDTRKQAVSIGPDKRRRKGGVTNQNIATFQEKMGRVFNNLSDLEIKKLARFHKKSVLRSIDRNIR